MFTDVAGVDSCGVKVKPRLAAFFAAIGSPPPRSASVLDEGLRILFELALSNLRRVRY